jgi:cyclic pyranopterin monophosphate synthase
MAKRGSASGLTHLSQEGEARMVDVSGKPATIRTAVAEAILRMKHSTRRAVLEGSGPKGEVLATARVAGILAAKRTSEAIPLCHALALASVEIAFDTDLPRDARGRAGLRVLATARCTGPTGVEMEALHAAALAALTVYDMAKALEKGIEVEKLRLLEKTGGKSGSWRETGNDS